MNVTRSLFAATLAVGLMADAGAADITQSGFSPLYLGVDFETATVPSNPTATGAPTTSRASRHPRAIPFRVKRFSRSRVTMTR